MRALFLATPNSTAARVLWRWLEAGHEVAEFWYPAPSKRKDWRKDWRQDRRIGLLNRHWSVSAALRRHGIADIAVPPPARAEPELLARAAGLGADVLICCHFTHRITPALLDLFGRHAVNFHPALLPAYRGPVPTLAMLLAGEADRHGGVTLHLITPELDAGDIIAAEPLPCPARASLPDWRLALARAAGELTAGPLLAYLDGQIEARPQSGPASYINGPMTKPWLTIDARWTAARVQDTLRRLGSRHPLQAELAQNTVTVTGFLRRLGPPNGQPPQSGDDRLAMDVADARILLATRQQHGGWRRLLELLAIARTPH